MRFAGWAAIAAAGLIATGAQAQSPASNSGQTPGWYIGGEASWTHLDRFNAPSGAPFTVRPAQGFGAGATAGYEFPSGLRLEGEAIFRNNDVDRVGGPGYGGSSGGAIRSEAFMGNVLYDFLPNERLTPYIGGGVGIANVSLNGISSAGNRLVDDQDHQFAYQGIAGMKYALDPNWSTSLDYRYFATLNPHFAAIANAGGGEFDAEHHSHNVMLSLAYHFAPPPPQPEAAAPEPAPVATPAPPPPQTRKFLVFFDFDQATLTPDGAQVVRQAAEQYKTGGSAKLDVSGYTDLAGTASYNMDLSKRRADTVKTALLTEGVPDSAVVEEWHGKENPRVPTADGIREPQNRRVELMMDGSDQPQS